MLVSWQGVAGVGERNRYSLSLQQRLGHQEPKGLQSLPAEADSKALELINLQLIFPLSKPSLI